MERYSILDRSSSPAPLQPGAEGENAPANRPQSTSISAAIAAANASLAAKASIVGPGPRSRLRFPGDDGGHSLADIAQRDLDAALQLLAERAQYITGASGTAIALRRPQRQDMLCHARVGSNAPEVGALLSTESGLSGESVRTRLPLRCDDTERDPRVNRDGCRELGISSVVVMPILRDDEVLGVFELFSEKVNAFGERDISAVQRLGEMVETAVKLAETARPFGAESQPENAEKRLGEEGTNEIHFNDSEVEAVSDEAPQTELSSSGANSAEAQIAASAANVSSAPAAVPNPKKPLMWSAALQAAQESPGPPSRDQSHLPPVLRNLHKCWACGFPVSEGRKLCVECEEKQWRGQLRTTSPSATSPVPRPVTLPAVSKALAAAASGTALVMPETGPSSQQSIAPSEKLSNEPLTGAEESGRTKQEDETTPAPPEPVLLSAGIEPSQSWLSRNKFIVIALVAMVAVIAAILLLR